ncbi:MAG: pectin acetylesterase-family hydrolase [Myxococcota bacterium]
MKFKAWLVRAGVLGAALAMVGGCGDDAPSGSTVGGECGDGVVEGYEQCDDGNADDTDGCTSQCIEWEAPAGDPVVADDHTWEWIDVPGAVCRDGSPAGFAVNLDSSSDRVMIYLEGGGACFDQVSCGANPARFDSSAFGGRSGGIFDRTHGDNPMAGWNHVYVPYCTGDVHAGLAEDVMVPGLDEPQQFVGYRNTGLFLERIVPTFADAELVVLTGASAGGFGAAANAAQVQRDFGDVPVVLLDDSGPPMSSEQIAPCLQAQWRELWGLENTMLADCQWDCDDPDDFVVDLAVHLAQQNPDRVGGLFSHRQDQIIRFFYGFGQNECDYTIVPSSLPEDEFERGLDDFKNVIQAETNNFGTYYTDGTDHTCIAGGCFYDAEVGGVPLTAWVADLIDGQVSHVAP